MWKKQMWKKLLQGLGQCLKVFFFFFSFLFISLVFKKENQEPMGAAERGRRSRKTFSHAIGCACLIQESSRLWAQFLKTKEQTV